MWNSGAKRLSGVPFEVLTAVLLKIRSSGLLRYAVVPDVSNTIVSSSSGWGSLQRNLLGLLVPEDERTTCRRNASVTCPSTPLHNAEEMNFHRFFTWNLYSILILIYSLTAIGLSPGGSSTLHVYTQTIHRTTQITTNVEECSPCRVFASSTLAFALQLRKKHGKTSVRVRKTSVRLRKSSVRVQTSVRLRKTSVRVKTSGRVRKTSVRLRKSSE